MEESGLDKVWEKIENYFKLMKENNYFESNRKKQSVFWMHESIEHQLKEKLYRHPAVRKELLKKEKAVEEGKISSFKAASELLKLFES